MYLAGELGIMVVLKRLRIHQSQGILSGTEMFYIAEMKHAVNRGTLMSQNVSRRKGQSQETAVFGQHRRITT